MVVAGAFGDLAEPVYKGDHQALEGAFRVGQALFEQSLPDDSVSQAAFGIGDDAPAHRVRDDFLQADDLPVHPFLVFDHFADIFNQQAQQAHQPFMNLGFVSAVQLDLDPEGAQQFG